ncbi:MAG TPA: hypothetical protein VK081_09925 [Planctomycetota bacterium]|nr:hypothetical protein [Planctomycetota bacterium]
MPALSLYLSLGIGASAARATAQEALQLFAEPTSQSIVVHALQRTTAVLVLGTLSVPPIPLPGIVLEVVPDAIVPLGVLDAGERVTLFVPRAVSHLLAEAVGLVAETGRLTDAGPIPLLDAFTDIVRATFHAELISTDGIPPIWSVGAVLTAPSSGYELSLDGFKLVEDRTEVYLRLTGPGPNEFVLPVLTEHRISVELGSEVGRSVRVWLMRATRGQPGPFVYEPMAELQARSGQ